LFLLQHGAARLGSGDLEYRLTVTTGDEFQTLADEFNHMAGQLQTSYATLEQQVEERTRALARSVQELQALGAVSQTVNSTLDLQTVLTTIVAHAVQLSGGHGGVIYEYDEGTRLFHLRVTHGVHEEIIAVLRGAHIRLGEGAMGTAAVTHTPVQVPDMMDEHGSVLPRVRPTLAQAGYRSLLAVPLLLEQQI